MRALLLLVSVVVASPSFGQASRRPATTETARPLSAVYSWTHEADGRFVADTQDGLTHEQRAAWADDPDAPAAGAPRRPPVAPASRCAGQNGVCPGAPDVSRPGVDPAEATTGVVG